MKKNTKINIREIAAACNVSITTISRYFNNPELLSPTTHAKIEQALRELNFQPGWSMPVNETHTTNIIGIIFPHLQFGFYTEMLNQLVEEGKSKGYHFIPYTSTGTKKDELAAIRALCQYRIKGILLFSHLLDAEEIQQLPVPVITVERAGGSFMQINNDNFTGGQLAAELLLRNQCEVFIHVNNGYNPALPSFKRISGFECLIEGRPYERIISPELTEPNTSAAKKAMQNIVKTLISKYSGKKWGVFCSNDDIARLFEQRCIREQLSIPDQVEIIGYDNSPVSDYAAYQITSVAQNIQLMAHLAIEGFDNYVPCETIVPSTLIEKDTTSSSGRACYE